MVLTCAFGRGAYGDLDGTPDVTDICPYNADNICPERCARASRYVDYGSILAGGGGVWAWLGGGIGAGIAIIAGVGGAVYGVIEKELGDCY